MQPVFDISVANIVPLSLHVYRIGIKFLKLAKKEANYLNTVTTNSTRRQKLELAYKAAGVF